MPSTYPATASSTPTGASAGWKADATMGALAAPPMFAWDPTATNRVVTLRFVRLPEGLLPGLRPAAWRFASDANQWEVGGLPPGTYWPASSAR